MAGPIHASRAVRRRPNVLPAVTGATLAAVLSLLLLPALRGAGLEAQEVGRVRVQENFRASPDGLRIGVVEPGTELRLGRREGQWVEATLEGWIWTRSLQVFQGGRYDLVVSVEGGENVRAAPSGTVIARVDRETVLEELERVPGWIRARRTGWIWAPSLEIAQGEALEEEEEAPVEGEEAPVEGEEAAADPPARAAPASTRWRRAGERGAAILTGPDGDTLAVSRPGSELEILGREGSWARVRVEGWTWLPPGDEGGEAGAVEAVEAVTPREVADAPERYRGAVVEWELQFISLERAEPIRTDFYEGEPFLLARSGQDREEEGAGGTFVYVAVPPERVPEMEGLTPLERITVVGRVRTGSATLTGSPILDLLELVRGPGGR